jgi:hypothetical protein
MSEPADDLHIQRELYATPGFRRRSLAIRCYN